MTAAGAVLQESVLTSFANKAVLRRYLILPLLLGLTLLVAWPRASFAMILATDASNDTILWVALGLTLAILYLNARLGAEEYSPEAASHVRDYATLTPVSLSSVVAGKLCFGILHTIFLVALGAPFLLAAFAVSGAAWPQFWRMLAVIGSAGFAARQYGFFLLALTGSRALARNTITIPGIVAFLIFTFLFAPEVNPLQVLIDVSRSPAALAARTILGIPAVTFLVLSSLFLGGVFSVSALAVLRVVRGRAAGGGDGRG
jgi:hypothetical protein